jgi:hypothetical protein
MATPRDHENRKAVEKLYPHGIAKNFKVIKSSPGASRLSQSGMSGPACPAKQSHSPERRTHVWVKRIRNT